KLGDYPGQVFDVHAPGRGRHDERLKVGARLALAPAELGDLGEAWVVRHAGADGYRVDRAPFGLGAEHEIGEPGVKGGVKILGLDKRLGAGDRRLVVKHGPEKGLLDVNIVKARFDRSRVVHLEICKNNLRPALDSCAGRAPQGCNGATRLPWGTRSERARPC